MTLFAQSKESVPIDEFGSVNCEDYLARMDNVILQAANNVDSKIYVLVYEGKVSRYVYERRGKSRIQVSDPEVGLANARIVSMKKYLAFKKYDDRKFVFLSAGYRENFTVEIWLVPDNAKKPVPRATVAKMNYRKGKPSGFCLECCGP